MNLATTLLILTLPLTGCAGFNAQKTLKVLECSPKLNDAAVRLKPAVQGIRELTLELRKPNPDMTKMRESVRPAAAFIGSAYTYGKCVEIAVEDETLTTEIDPPQE
jgi:hypothetical protein